jgi:tRNA G10  N-methylase Trm11
MRWVKLTNKLIIFLNLDPFCGKSTILAEFLNTTCQKSFFISSDADQDQIQCSQKNTQSLKNKQSYDLLLSNLVQFSRLPYRDHIFDLIITDLPFEINHAVKYFEPNRSIFYETVLLEFNRLLCQTTGILVLLINYTDIELFKETVLKLSKQHDEFLMVQSTNLLSLGKTTAHLVRLNCQQINK